VSLDPGGEPAMIPVMPCEHGYYVRHRLNLMFGGFCNGSDVLTQEDK
jgi:hypothetical protein